MADNSFDIKITTTGQPGCATPRPTSDDPAVYRPAHPIHYPVPR